MNIFQSAFYTILIDNKYNPILQSDSLPFFTQTLGAVAIFKNNCFLYFCIFILMKYFQVAVRLWRH